MPYKNKEDNNACQRRWYKRNKAKKKAQNKAREKAIQAFVCYGKHWAPCSDCGERYPYWVMDYDHTNGDKKFCLSNAFKRSSWRLVFEELSKCELVCANCHRDRTHQRSRNLIGKDVSLRS